MTKEGRCLGLVGGLGPGATVYYYNGLLAAHKAQGRVARMLIAHADVDHGRPLAEANKLDELARYLNGFIDATAAGGAEMAAIVAVTPHICAAAVVFVLPLSIAVWSRFSGGVRIRPQNTGVIAGPMTESCQSIH